MKHSITTFTLLLALFGGSVASHSAQNTAFTYQGRLTANGGPANGSHDFQFTLFGGPSGGSPIDNPVSIPAVSVSNGLFTVQLNFDEDALIGGQQWLSIAVRPAGGGTFTTLSPRQPLTAAPLAIVARTALNALNVSSVDGHSLDAADGSPSNVVFVDNAGKVGVGTTSPISKLHVYSGDGVNLPPRLESPGGSTFGAGWDFYPSGVGKGYVGVPDAGAAFAPGEMLVFGGPGVPVSLWAGQTRALTVMPDGDVQLGASGQFHAASGEENLRIVRGTVSGTGAVLAGAGFQVAHEPGGRYVIAFHTPFAAPPAVTCSGIFNGPGAPVTLVHGTQAGSVSISSSRVGGGDESFYFIAVGPR
jgi:hypothetical protein